MNSAPRKSLQRACIAEPYVNIAYIGMQTTHGMSHKPVCKLGKGNIHFKLAVNPQGNTFY